MIDLEITDGPLPLDHPEIQKAKQWYRKMGQTIRNLRKENKLTQEELAKKCRLSQTAISRIERGDLIPGPSAMKRIAKALGVEPGKIDPGWPENNEESW